MEHLNSAETQVRREQSGSPAGGVTFIVGADGVETLPSRVLRVCRMEVSCRVSSNSKDSSEVRRRSKISRISDMAFVSGATALGRAGSS